MDFYNIYVKLCKEIGKTPSRVAVEAGFSKATVNRWKNGGGCTDANLVTLSDYFTKQLGRSITVEYLTGEEPVQKEKTINQMADGLTEEKRKAIEIIMSASEGKAKRYLRLLEALGETE